MNKNFIETVEIELQRKSPEELSKTIVELTSETFFLNHEIERLNNIINELEKWYKKQYEDTNKCLDYAREHHNLQDTEKYTRDHNMIAMCIEKLEKLQELKEGK